MAVSLSSQHSFSLMPLHTAQAATKCRSLCRSYQVALCQTQEVADIDLHSRPSPKAQEPTHLVACLRPHQSTTQFTPEMIHPKDSLCRYQKPTKVNPTLRGQPLHNSLFTIVMASPQASQPDGQSHQITCQQQSRLNYNKRAHSTHSKVTIGATGSDEQQNGATGPHSTPVT